MRRLAMLLGIFLFAAATARGAEPAAEPAPIRILLTTGGHDFEAEPFYAMFDAMPGVTYTKATLPDQADLLRPGLEKQYQVLVRYDMCPGFSEAQQKDFVALLEKGIGLVSLHHNLGAHRDWPEYRKIIGGQFVLKEQEIDGQKYAVSTWSHGEDMQVTVADPNHPITRGIADFAIHDETYGGYYTSPDAHVLLRTNHPKNDPELSWVTRYGKSPVFYLMLGHDGAAYRNPNYAKLVEQAIRWAAASR